jgi:signal transduction histidine kinase
MATRRSLKLPIALGVVMIVLLIVLTVGWILLSAFGAIKAGDQAPLYWTMLAVGTVFLVLVLVGVIMYLALSVKAVNLTRRQSNFIDSVTHELKSPIASLKLYLQTLKRRNVGDEERLEFYRFMLDDVERLDHLINDVLEVGRLEREAVEGEMEDVEMGALLKQCAEEVCGRYRVEPDVVRLEASPCYVRARRLDLDMIFRNLIDNAVKYGDDQPQVEVTLDPRDDGRVVTRIADNGHGIPHKLRRKIFGRFVRLGLELERKKPGTGLGLYIVRTLVRRLRGQISVRDREDGSGAVFTVELPGVHTNGAPRSKTEVTPEVKP